MDEFTEEKWKIKMNPTVVAMRMYDVYPITIARMKKWFLVQRALNPIIRDIMNRHAILGIERALYYSYSKTIWKHTFKYPEYLWDKLIDPVREHFIKSYRADPKILDEIWSSQRHIMRILIHKLKTNRPTTMEPYMPRKPWEIHTRTNESWNHGVINTAKELDTTNINRKSEIEALTKKRDTDEYERQVIAETVDEVRKFLDSKQLQDLEAGQRNTVENQEMKEVDISDLPEEIRENPDVLEALDSAEYYLGKYEGVVLEPKISRLVEEAKQEIEKEGTANADKGDSDIVSMGVGKTGRKRGKPSGSRKAMGKTE